MNRGDVGAFEGRAGEKTSGELERGAVPTLKASKRHTQIRKSEFDKGVETYQSYVDI